MVDLFVANFPYDTEQSELDTIFSRYGEVESVKIITDRVTGCSRGFGFVRMAKSGAEAAVEALNQAIFGGRALRVRLANPVQRPANPNDQMGYPDPYGQGYNDHGQGYNSRSYAPPRDSNFRPPRDAEFRPPRDVNFRY
ncbi:MAG: RNA-binding protein [Deltaproteobacteria bacterium]|jgi:RNA recognition motif-containing protein|nr:RNA-binding protein [Deltaproteobacteria bacterium]